MKGPTATVIVAILIIAFLLIPIGYLFVGLSFFAVGPISSYSILSPMGLGVLANSLILGFSCGILATVLGTIYAWIIHRTNVPGKRTFELIALLGLTIPLLLKIFAWIFLLSPQIGIINGILEHFDSPPLFNIFSFAGVIFVTSLDVVPVSFLIVGPALKSMDPALEEAAVVSGHPPYIAFLSVTVRVILPAVLSSVVLLSLLTMNFFEVPLILGGGRLNTFATEMYYWAAESAPPRFDVAAYYGIVNIVAAFSIFAVYLYLTKRAFKYEVVTGKATNRSVHEFSRRGKWLAFSVCFLILLFVYLLPYGTVIFMSFVTRGNIFNATLGLSNYTAAFSIQYFWQSVINSLITASTASALSTIIALVLSYAALRGRVTGSRVVEVISNIPLAVSGIVYGFALFITFLIAPGLGIIYGTLVPLVIAITFIYLPTSMRIIAPSLIQLSSELEEASYMTGAGWVRTFSRITIGLMKTGLFSSFIRGFLDGMRELGPVVLLTTTSTTVVIALLFNVYILEPNTLNILAAGSVVLTAIAAIMLLIFSVIDRKVFSRHRS